MKVYNEGIQAQSRFLPMFCPRPCFRDGNLAVASLANGCFACVTPPFVTHTQLSQAPIARTLLGLLSLVGGTAAFWAPAQMAILRPRSLSRPSRQHLHIVRACEPPCLSDVALAPGLGYENGRLTAWMPNLIQPRGVELMRIPRSSYLIEALGEEASVSRLNTDKDDSGKLPRGSILTPTHINLAVRLLSEKETLPGADVLFQRRHTPLHRWSETELLELQCETLKEDSLAERTWIREQHASAALGCTARPLETFLAAVDAVRVHGLPSSGSLVVAPATCLLERSVPRGATVAVDGTGDLVIKSDGGGGLTVSAGWLTNDELLLAGGRALLDCDTESVVLREEVLWEAAEEAARTQPPVCDSSPSEWDGPVALASRERRTKVVEALRRFCYIQPTDELAVLAGGLCSDPLGNFMQVLCLSEEELALFGEQGCAVNIGETVPISRQHETRCRQLPPASLSSSSNGTRYMLQTAPLQAMCSLALSSQHASRPSLPDSRVLAAILPGVNLPTWLAGWAWRLLSPAERPSQHSRRRWPRTRLNCRAWAPRRQTMTSRISRDRRSTSGCRKSALSTSVNNGEERVTLLDFRTLARARRRPPL